MDNYSFVVSNLHLDDKLRSCLIPSSNGERTQAAAMRFSTTLQDSAIAAYRSVPTESDWRTSIAQVGFFSLGWTGQCLGRFRGTFVSTRLGVRVLQTVTGLCVADSLNSSFPPVSDGELNLQPLSLVSGDLKKSLSTSVQCTPETEKKYVHRVYEAITPH
ncbi:hypothetical protein C5167_036827 [Papaver somniferum]|uniref:Uncharacterized protein n=1 Tax=Papaver somniferum TaxID=3469 RepID=A0A4Y7I750_PAPSO|nr:hypothetical protein C5167_036827 [Papaver somniferum]